MVAERQLCRMVDEAEDLERRNKRLPHGAAVSTADFVVACQFVRQVATAIREAGLAFTGTAALGGAASPAEATSASEGPVGKDPAAGETGGSRLYRLSSCGVVAQARVEDGKWIVLAGSQVRSIAQPSAGSIASRQRQELIHDGGLVERQGHLLLTEDLPFSTASGAVNFVVGSRHKPEIWRPDPSPFEQGPRL